MQEKHVVALEMIPTMGIKLATSTALSILTTCTADLVSVEKKKILMFAATVWARAWFLWAPFIFVLKRYFVVLPLTVFATLNIIGGILTSIVNHSHHKSINKKELSPPQLDQPVDNIENVKTISGTIDFFKVGATKRSYNVEKEK